MFARTNTANKTVEEVIRLFTKFFSRSLDFIGDIIKTGPQSETSYANFQKASFEVQNSLESFNTIQKLITGLKRKGLYEEPGEFVIKSKTVENNGVLEEEIETGIIMPIEHQIKKFLEMPNVFDEIMKTQNREIVDGFYSNLIDGELWKRLLDKFEGKIVVPIYLYYDDFQPDSALSPHAKASKLGAYYYSFPTLPDYLATNLKNIFIAVIVRAADINLEDIERQDYDPVMYAIFEVLIKLESEGILLNINGERKRIYIVLPQVLGDNLSLNGCLGFLMGFTAKYICRICVMPKDDREVTTIQDVDLFRNQENFEECLEGITIDERKGVKYNCALNFLKSFKVYNNYCMDIMHDVYSGSGIFKIQLQCILQHYIDRETFTLSAFNKAKEDFKYGKKESGNKTAEITDKHLLNGLKMNAKEVWTLVEYLPLILMTIVPDFINCPIFAFSVTMAKVVNLIMKSTYTADEINKMEEGITDHHTKFLDHFNIVGKHLTPKYHNMLHYGTCIRLSGALKKTMVFKFEQKHQELKQYARVCYCRINLPLSICRKFCLEYSRHFLDKRNMFTLIRDISFTGESDLLGLYPCEVSQPIQSLHFKAVHYELGDLVYYQHEAYRIEEIVKDCNADEVFLYSRRINFQYEEHLGFYKVINYFNEFEIIDISELEFAPVNIHHVEKFDSYYFKIKSF